MNPFNRDPFLPCYDFEALENEPDPAPQTVRYAAVPYDFGLPTPDNTPSPAPKTFQDLLRDALRDNVNSIIFGAKK